MCKEFLATDYTENPRLRTTNYVPGNRAIRIGLFDELRELKIKPGDYFHCKSLRVQLDGNKEHLVARVGSAQIAEIHKLSPSTVDNRLRELLK